MTGLIQQIRLAFTHRLPERRQIIAWLVSLLVFIAISFVSRIVPSGSSSFLGYAFGLYALDTLIFFALFGEQPKMKLVMLTFIFLLEIAAIGYYLLTFNKI